MGEPCRLYLTTPPELVSGGVLLRDFLPMLERVLDAADVACLLIAAPASATDDALSAVAQPLIQAAQARGVAVLLPGRVPLAMALKADGIHLDLRGAAPAEAMRTYRDARKTLGDDVIVGALCPPERHLAMDLGEADASYVGFDVAAPETAEVIAWWGEVMTVPCVAFGRVDAAAATALAESGADFIAPAPELWSEGDPVAAVAALGAAIR